MKKVLLWFFIAIAILNAKSYQQYLPNGSWALVGINGYHRPYNQAISFTSTSGYVLIKDRNDTDDNVTWDMYSQTQENNTSNPDTGDERYSTVGVQILRTATPKLYEVNLNYKKIDKDENDTFYTMYISSSGLDSLPNVKLEYQDDYEGSEFLISFNDLVSADKSIIYRGRFNKFHTYNKPAKLPRAHIDGAVYRKIVDIIDTNLSDNNTTNLDHFDVAKNEINHRDDDGILVGGRQTLADSGDGVIVAYRWDITTQQWRIFNSNSSTANDFENITAGDAYWFKYTTTSNYPAGLVLAEGDINGSRTYDRAGGLIEDSSSKLAAKQWNLLSFDEDFNMHSSSAVFILDADYKGTGLIIRRGIIAENNITVPASVTDSNITASAFINNYAFISDQNGTWTWKVRAYPVSYPANGLLIISDERIDVNATNVTSIAGQSMGDSKINASGYAMYSGRVDEYITGLEINNDYITLANQQGAVGIQTFKEDEYNSDVSTDATVDDVVDQINTDFIANDGGAISRVIAIDTDLDRVADTAVIASTSRYRVKDNTYVRVFEYNGTIAPQTSQINGDAGYTNFSTDSSISQTVTNINNKSATTGVVAYALNTSGSKNRIMITSNSKEDLDIKEKRYTSQFYNLYLDDNISMNGVVSKLYSGYQLSHSYLSDFNRSATDSSWSTDKTLIISKDNNVGRVKYFPALYSDLKESYINAEESDISSPAYTIANTDFTSNGYAMENIITGTTTAQYIYWNSSDLTENPKLWKNELALNQTYKVDKRDGVWVYLANPSSNNINIKNIINYHTTTRRVDNNFETSGFSVGEITNHREYTIEFDVENLIDGNETIDTNTYATQITVNGRAFIPKNQPTSYHFSINFDDYMAEGIRDKIYPALNSGVTITATNGKSKIDNYTFFIDNVKPDTPDAVFTDSNQTKIYVISYGADYIKLFDGNISDLDSEYDNILLTSARLEPKDVNYTINPATSSKISFGTQAKPYYDLRLIGTDVNNSWSNMRRVYYAPVYKATHILENNDTNRTTYDSSPIAYNSDGNSWSWWADGDNGIQFKFDDNNTAEGNRSILSYKPVPGAKLNQTTPYTVDIETDTGAKIGTIAYHPDYAGDIFYVDFEDNVTPTNSWLFYGTFPSVTGGTIQLTLIDTTQRFKKVQ